MRAGRDSMTWMDSDAPARRTWAPPLQVAEPSRSTVPRRNPVFALGGSSSVFNTESGGHWRRIVERTDASPAGCWDASSGGHTRTRFRNQTGCSRHRTSAPSRAPMAEPAEPDHGSDDGRSHLGARGRSADGETRADRISQPSNPEAHRSGSPVDSQRRNLTRAVRLVGRCPCGIRAILTGANVSRHANGLRIERACESLLAGEAVTTALLSSGFNTRSNFNREFRRITGKSPSDWREAARRS